MTMDAEIWTLSVEGGVVTLTYRRRLPHPVEEVWAALTDPGRRKAWFGETTIEPRQGGMIEMMPDEPPAAPDAKRMTGRILVWHPPGSWSMNGGSESSRIAWSATSWPLKGTAPCLSSLIAA